MSTMNPTTLPEVKTLFAQRLSQARRMRGLSLRALSDKMDPAVSYNALHKYEAGVMLPDSAVLRSMAATLGQSVDFFFRPITVTLESIEFRKKSKLGAKQIDAIREEATDFFERYLQVEKALGLDTEFNNPIAHLSIKRPDEIEEASTALRKAWELGMAPLGNVVELLEHHQIKVQLQKADSSFDGFAGRSGKIPVIVLNKVFPADRIRLTALHELGHLLLTFDRSVDEKMKEKLCHRFAGSMLIPRAVFENEFGHSRAHVTLVELTDMKAEYGISIAAIMARALDLGLITIGMYTQFCILRNRKHWNSHEPGVYSGKESSNRFDQLLHRAVATEVISLSLASSLAKIPLAEFRESVQLIP